MKRQRTREYGLPARQWRWQCLAMGLIMQFLLVASGVAAEQGTQLPKILRAGFLAKIYHDIDQRDAKAATELLAREISRKMGITSNPQVIIYEELATLNAAIRRGELDMVSVPTLDYLRIRDKVPLTPAVVGAHNGGRGSSYLLVVRRGSGIRTFADLRGKSVLLLPAGRHEPSRLWLDLQVARVGGGAVPSYFRTIREYPKVSQAVMAIFFKKADAALVTRTAFETGRLLNPQIGRNLAVIAESDYYSDGITCFPANVSPQVQTIITSAIHSLNMTVTGRQLYTIFQTTGTTPYKREYLEGLERLLHERDRLLKKPARKSTT